MTKLSLTMIVKNESKYLSRCIKSVQNIVDEVIVVDTGSTDETKNIALLYGAKVYNYKWENNFSNARNFALQKSTGDWNLVLDADEYIVNNCNDEIAEFINGNPAIGRIKVVNKFEQDGEIKYSQSFISRLIPKAVYYTGRVHEQLVSDCPRRNTSITVNHDGYYQTDKSERNLKLLHLELDDNPKNDYILYQIAKQYKLIKRFDLADSYFEKCYALIPSNVSYRPNLIVEYLYNIINNGNLIRGLEVISREKHFLNEHPDFHFASALFHMELIYKNPNQYGHLLSMIEKEYLTCLKLGETQRYDSVIGTGTFLASYNLGVFYETTGNIDKARFYYEKSAEYEYERAFQRLSNMRY